jgi:hypothetical protein
VPARVIVVNLGEIFWKIVVLKLCRKIVLLVRGVDGDERGPGPGVRSAIICGVIGHRGPP